MKKCRGSVQIDLPRQMTSIGNLFYGGYGMLDLEEWMDIKAMKREGHSIREIARRNGAKSEYNSESATEKST